MVSPSRVDITAKAAEMVRTLAEQHGPLMFHQSGGCCDGSSPMCFAKGDFLTGDSDQLLGTLDAELSTELDDRSPWDGAFGNADRAGLRAEV